MATVSVLLLLKGQVLVVVVTHMAQRDVGLSKARLFIQGYILPTG
jgi:hypothetical protein